MRLATDQTTKLVCMPLTDIRVDADMQARAEMDWPHVNQLARYIKDGVQMADPLLVYFDGTYYWLVDGFHRYSAMMQVDGIPDPTCKIVEGTKQEAEVEAMGQNGSHGKPLTRAERNQNAIDVLGHPLCADWTSEQIGLHVGLSESTVHRVRTRLSERSVEAEPAGDAEEAVDGQEEDVQGAEESAAPSASSGAGGASIMRDKLDNVITSQAAQEAFIKSAPLLRQLQINMQESRKLLKELCVGQGGRYMPRQQADADMKNVWAACKHSLPYCVVPDAVKGTDSRWDCGWMNRTDYDLLIPEHKHPEGGGS
jgi:hypothetical protein